MLHRWICAQQILDYFFVFRRIRSVTKNIKFNRFNILLQKHNSDNEISFFTKNPIECQMQNKKKCREVLIYIFFLYIGNFHNSTDLALGLRLAMLSRIDNVNGSFLFGYVLISPFCLFFIHP